MIKKIKVENRALTAEEEIEIEVEVNQISVWMIECPGRCSAVQFLDNYVRLFGAYMIQKKHIDNCREHLND